MSGSGNISLGSVVNTSNVNFADKIQPKEIQKNFVAGTEGPVAKAIEDTLSVSLGATDNQSISGQALLKEMVVRLQDQKTVIDKALTDSDDSTVGLVAHSDMMALLALMISSMQQMRESNFQLNNQQMSISQTQALNQAQSQRDQGMTQFGTALASAITSGVLQISSLSKSAQNFKQSEANIKDNLVPMQDARVKLDRQTDIINGNNQPDFINHKKPVVEGEHTSGDVTTPLQVAEQPSVLDNDSRSVLNENRHATQEDINQYNSQYQQENAKSIHEQAKVEGLRAAANISASVMNGGGEAAVAGQRADETTARMNSDMSNQIAGVAREDARRVNDVINQLIGMIQNNISTMNDVASSISQRMA